MSNSSNPAVRLFLCGDVMTGRGIDQILAFPSNPTLHEGFVKDARGYVDLAMEINGTIPRPAEPFYIWGIALEAFQRQSPDVKVINLETAVTTSDDAWLAKGIHYRMNPRNVGALATAGIDCCTLANNHVLDWGYDGLRETLVTLAGANIDRVGAGRTLTAARRPFIADVSTNHRVIVFGIASPSSGVPERWAASDDRPGVFLMEEEDENAVSEMTRLVDEFKQPGDAVVISIHWGANWGYEIPPGQQRFARALIDEVGADLVFGHSSHHVKGIEVYRDKLIVYGAGDLITDYEGIGGYKRYRGELSAMYFPTIDPVTGSLLHLRMIPTRMKRFQLTQPSAEEVEWLADVLQREGRPLGTSVTIDQEQHLTLTW